VIETVVAFDRDQFERARLIGIAPDRALRRWRAVGQVFGRRGGPALQIFLLLVDGAQQARIGLKTVTCNTDRRRQRLLQ